MAKTPTKSTAMARGKEAVNIILLRSIQATLSEVLQGQQEIRDLLSNRPSQPIAAPVAVDPSGLHSRERQILTTITNAVVTGVQMIPRSWIAVLSGWNPASSGFSTLIAKLRSQGYIFAPAPGQLSTTSLAASSIVDVPVKLELADFDLQIRAVLERADADIVCRLLETPFFPQTREEVALAAGQSSTSSTFRSRLAKLGKLGLLEVRSDKLSLKLDWWPREKQ